MTTQSDIETTHHAVVTRYPLQLPSPWRQLTISLSIRPQLSTSKDDTADGTDEKEENNITQVKTGLDDGSCDHQRGLPLVCFY